MRTRTGLISWSISIALAVLISVLTTPSLLAQKKDTLELHKIPPKVMASLTTKFPDAQIRTWTRETEGDILIYDIEFLQAGRKFEADIKENGTIQNWEAEIQPGDLPARARAVVEERYPGSRLKEVMAITEVTDEEESLQAYEILIETADGMSIELTMAPDGTILEDSGVKE